MVFYDVSLYDSFAATRVYPVPQSGLRLPLSISPSPVLWCRFYGLHFGERKLSGEERPSNTRNSQSGNTAELGSDTGMLDSRAQFLHLMGLWRTRYRGTGRVSERRLGKGSLTFKIPSYTFRGNASCRISAPCYVDGAQSSAFSLSASVASLTLGAVGAVHAGAVLPVSGHRTSLTVPTLQMGKPRCREGVGMAPALS